MGNKPIHPHVSRLLKYMQRIDDGSYMIMNKPVLNMDTFSNIYVNRQHKVKQLFIYNTYRYAVLGNKFIVKLHNMEDDMSIAIFNRCCL